MAADPDVVISVADAVTDELVDAFARLIPQLSSSNHPPDAEAIDSLLSAEACTILVARDGAEGAIVGTLTLVVFPLPTAVRAWIEDVVVDESARGRGVGEKLNRHALDRARAAGAKTVDLTSRPARQEANRLYARIGFEPRQTNVYRYNL